MAMDPISTTTAYCTGAQAVQFFDVRLWGDLLADDGTRVAAGSVPGHATLAAELLAASGEIEQAVMRGGRYKPVDLIALQSASTAGGAYLAKMVASLAMWNLMERRNPDAQMSMRIARTYESMDQLSKGEAVFGFQEVMDAGVSSTASWYEDQSDLVNSPVYQARRMFGNRNLTAN